MNKQQPKLEFYVSSKKGEKKITLDGGKDLRIGQEADLSRTPKWFVDLEDMKETLNWNYNGDSSKFKISWMTIKGISHGVAKVFD